MSSSGVSSSDELAGADAMATAGVSTVYRYGTSRSVRDELCTIRQVDPAATARASYSVKEENMDESAGFGYAQTAVSFYGGPNVGAGKNKLHRQMCLMGPLHRPGAWCSYTNTGAEWYQMDAGTLQWFAGIMILGRSDADHWVRKNAPVTASVRLVVTE
jgi:hypothetical protein